MGLDGLSLGHIYAFSRKTRLPILKPEGFALHCFPEHQAPVEPHLFMPVVHRLLKNLIRNLGIRTMVALGIEPQWRKLEIASATDKALRYYRC